MTSACLAIQSACYELLLLYILFIFSDIKSGIVSTRTFLLRSTRLMTSHQANLSKSALVFSDIQLKEAKEQDTAMSRTKPPFGR